MNLQIGNKIITTPLLDIVYYLQKELKSYNGKLQDVIDKGNNIVVTCPNNDHKGGHEGHPSCQIYNSDIDEGIPLGIVHCFSCGFKCTFPQFVGYCFDEDEQFGNEWLLQNCDTAFLSQSFILPEIVIDKKSKSVVYMDEKELQKYSYYHNYMWKRKLTREVVDLFDVGYDKDTDMLVFPVRDERGNLLWVTKRSVSTKRFEIPENVDKPVYLLYYIKKHNIKTCVVTEAQIDALTSWSYGVPCVATMGTPSKQQMRQLNESGIRTFITMFDNDLAGKQFELIFNNLIRKDVFVYNVKIPSPYKDINDLDETTFCQVLYQNGLDINSLKRQVK